MPSGCPYGSHRSLEPAGSLPQAAWRLDNTPEPLDNEILVDVDTLNIDSASFTQLEEEAGHDPARLAARILEIVAQRGKMHNPVTGSGGMFMGTVSAVGRQMAGRVATGVRIASLVSLSLTPLVIDEILEVRPATDQVKVRGRAILFESAIWAALPDDFPEEVALAALDVAGAAAQTARLARPGDTVLVVGAGGKSGMLCLAEARRRVGPTGRVVALCHSERSRGLLTDLGLADAIVVGDATRPLEVLRLVQEANQGRLVDLAINCANVPGTEMGTILPVRQGGTVYFFNMATSFTAAALGAEGIGKDVTMLIGNGYVPGHDLITLQLLRDHPRLRQLFETRYASRAPAGAGAETGG
ncbi:MAG TPA: L-erythro-3,5-diaminohexanoate dehydrogenase [Candidatus Nitrosotenuis sp.]|nr:L-erythro-3,5-diaminohexanoate dehydrogenase [Candidatus Nitrosotenuis sp.]